ALVAGTVERAHVLRIRSVQARLLDCAHAASLGLLDALAGGRRVGVGPRRGAGDRDPTDARRVAPGERERDRGAHRAAGQVHRPRDPQRVEQRHQIGHDAVHRDDARLLRHPEAPLVVAQDAECTLESRERVVPALDAAADLVDQYQGFATAAALVVTETRAVGLDPAHRLTPRTVEFPGET